MTVEVVLSLTTLNNQGGDIMKPFGLRGWQAAAASEVSRVVLRVMIRTHRG